MTFVNSLPPASEGLEKVMFSLMSVCLSTPPAGQATYAAGGVPLAVSQEDFLIYLCLDDKQVVIVFTVLPFPLCPSLSLLKIHKANGA